MMFPSLKQPRPWLLTALIGLSATGVAGLTHTPLTPFAFSTAYAEDELGQEVGKPLQQAQAALDAHHPAQALEFIKRADAVPTKTAYESYVIAQMRAAAASQAGDVPTALKAYDVLITNERTAPATRHQMLMAQASLAYGAHDYPSAARAASRYLREAGPNPAMQTLLLQCYYLQQDWKGLTEVGKATLAADQKAKLIPAENQLQMLATAYDKLHDITNKTGIYVKLVKYYARPQYWQMLIHDLTTDSTLTPRMVFNLQRLRLATGLLTNPAEFQDMAERAVQMGLPQLALNLLDEGYNRHLLGTGPQAAAQARFRAFVAQRANEIRAALPSAVEHAKTSPDAGLSLTAGYNLVLNGQVDQGIALMQQGLAKHPHQPDLARLTLGMALLDGGKRTEAIALFNSVDSDGAADNLAQLWAVQLTSHAASAGK
ncbi:tetratricopeptide repeat protein [Bombella sp. ESL0378]|uniref:tetratricopeptide repeat protein n=1 Tax=Bombella sp. ESL0378 TaxID=2676442 RepID=UPI0018C319BF|nr:tetratricopeptide repeat protein [Bombella sp. ESL0378]